MGKEKVSDLDQKDKDYIKVVHLDKNLSWDERLSILRNKFDKSERTIRRWIKKLGFSENRDIDNEQIRKAKLKKYNSKYILVTWAQNATPVHKPFWDNLLAYAEYLKADVGVIQGKYSAVKKDEWWEECLQPYLDGARQKVHTYLEILSDIKIKPTAVNPLTGLEGISGESTSVIGFPSIHLKPLPVLKGHQNKMLLTTGACTIANYSDSRIGKEAEFHHVQGAVLIEIKDDEIFYIRQITAESNGNFIDLIYSVKNKTVSEINKCAVFVYGDIHSSQLYQPIVRETNRLFQYLKPRRVVLHDLFNGESINHHQAADPIHAYHRQQEGKNILKKEIEGIYEFIDDNGLIKYNPIVVRSNHDEWIEKYIKFSDYKKDIVNAKEYMEYALILLSGEAKKGILPYLLEKKYGSDKITCLGLDDSFKILGWELGQHGHLGAHGSKGNIEQYRKLNTKVITGDWHVPQRRHGAASVGTYSILRQGFNNGSSAWAHAGIIVHTNGKMQHVIFAEDDQFTSLF